MHKYLRATAIAIALMSTAAIASCNTVQGMGEDVQAGGNAVSSAAADTQASMQNSAAPSDTGYAGENMASETRIDIASARARALSERPGQVTSQSLQRRDGGSGLRYSFDIQSDSVNYEVGVDAVSGAILQNRRTA
jgi:predicted small secreted protein